MNRLLRALLVAGLGLGLAGSASASKLAPYQEAALQKILATMPADQRALARPQLEATLANLSKEHVAMMLAGMANAKEEAPAPESSAPASDKEWGAAEADFDKAFAQARAYMARISDVRDSAGAPDLCRNTLNGVPIGRRRAANMADVISEQDRIIVRLMVEHRARYGTVDKFAKQLGQPVSSPLVQAVKYYFAAPMSESEVTAKLKSIQADAVRLSESHEAERKKIANGNYADRGSGIFSKTEEDLLAKLDARTEKATATLCEPALGYYHQGLISIIDPVVPKVRPFVQ